MDGLTVIRAAHACGLRVRVEADRVVVTGPKRFASLALCLIQNKPVIIAAISKAQKCRWRLAWSGEVAATFKREVMGDQAEPGAPTWLDAVCRAVRRDAGVDASRCPAGERDVIDMIIVGGQPGVRFDAADHNSSDIDLARHSAFQSVGAAPVIPRLVTVPGEHRWPACGDERMRSPAASGS
ncbi:MAG: hypothetical protein AB7G11_15720 [Phycisphaerales bacterium]